MWGASGSTGWSRNVLRKVDILTNLFKAVRGGEELAEELGVKVEINDLERGGEEVVRELRPVGLLAGGASKLDELVKALEELGVKVEINDFATGHRRPPFWLD
jgi:uncharacterized protein (DUF849 family)